jgi:chromosome segregation ATPase
MIRRIRELLAAPKELRDAKRDLDVAICSWHAEQARGDRLAREVEFYRQATRRQLEREVALRDDIDAVTKPLLTNMPGVTAQAATLVKVEALIDMYTALADQHRELLQQIRELPGVSEPEPDPGLTGYDMLSETCVIAPPDLFKERA